MEADTLPMRLETGPKKTATSKIAELSAPVPAIKTMFQFTLTWLDLTSGGRFMKTTTRYPRKTAENIAGTIQGVDFMACVAATISFG